MTKSHEKIAAFTFGVFIIGVMLAVSLGVPNPTDFQVFVFRVILALSAAGVAAMIPGFINLRINTSVRVRWRNSYIRNPVFSKSC